MPRNFTVHAAAQGRPLVADVLAAFDLLADGTLSWRLPPKNHNELRGRQAGRISVSSSGKRYRVVRFRKRLIRCSRVVFCMTHGVWPSDQIDHIDGNSLNDRPANLRQATQTQNAWNHKRRRKASECPMGVRSTASGRYQARSAVNSRQIALGTFPTVDAARDAYQTARAQFFGEFA